MFIRPLAFVKEPKQPQPAYAKLPGLLHTPLLVAGVMAPAFQSIYQWVFWREASKENHTQSCADLLYLLHETEGRYFWGGFVVTISLLYVIATLRWGYHRTAISLIRRWLPDLSNPPFKYFLVTTAAFGLWLSLCVTVIVYGLWHWRLDDDLKIIINDYAARHLSGLTIMLLFLGICFRFAGRNSELGMKALYGGRGKLSTVVSMVAVGGMAALSIALITM
ncbi:hypothetical protein [Pseudomonas sp. PB106]|uniref:hypothetical protein n=1 Tax=Pseudomonas sp. PB106 TaxID=2494699 RepID=UPI00131D9258|nr:hypothetical protein [Pseudomonas sp. PB106]KAE9641954.1 hypothetical protein EJA71_20085 [Pseudomonas sp. PB106]